MVRVRGIDIAEDRLKTQPGERVRGGDECERGHEHLAGQAERADHDLDADRRVAHGDGV